MIEKILTPKKPEEIFKNIEYRTPFPSNPEMQTFILGKHENIPPEFGWSLRGVKTVEDLYKPERIHVLNFLVDFAKKTKIRNFFSPVSDPQNGYISENRDFENKIEIGKDDNDESIFLHRSQKNLEGCEIIKGEMFITTTADCLTLIIKTKKEPVRVFAMHAGRETIFDINNPKRPTLMENVISMAKRIGYDPTDLEIYSSFGVAPTENFLHDEESGTHAKINKSRREFIEKKGWNDVYSNGYLNLYKMIENGFKDKGVPSSNITSDMSLDTLTAKDESGESRFFSNRRDSGELAGKGRNLSAFVWL